MFQDLNIFHTATAMAKHAGLRQSVIAQNIANADTPGFRAKDVAPFEAVFTASSTGAQRTTRSGHIRQSDTSAHASVLKFTDAEPSPNGNSVSLEEEMLKSVSVSKDHNKALAIYRHGMTVIRTVLGR